ncbi:MAG: NUDIX hydrolase [Actinomycetia bacterium]|nr:NUDIX hydrolase [Actinomycetes bacterium]
MTSDSAGMPEALTRRAEALLTGDTAAWTAPDTKDSATVILLRDSEVGPQTFLQRRVGSMKFAAGMYVFPGGRVEPQDADPQVPWRGDPAAEPFRQPDGASITATFRAVTVAAARETWEEAAVVLGANASGAPLSDTPSAPDVDVIDWLRECGGAVNAADLIPWAHWVTPEVERHRYDTRFLAVALPAGQAALDLGVESDNSLWISPEAALVEAKAGTMPMLPPTFDALERLVGYGTVIDALAAADPDPLPLMPRAIRTPQGNIRWAIVDAYSDEVLREL